MSFFYQWQVHPESRQCLTVVSHLGQHTFNCTMMGFRNSPAYVQRKMDKILADMGFAKAYIDDVVTGSRMLEVHIAHIR
jgi:hypothetical protein